MITHENDYSSLQELLLPFVKFLEKSENFIVPFPQRELLIVEWMVQPRKTEEGHVLKFACKIAGISQEKVGNAFIGCTINALLILKLFNLLTITVKIKI